MHQCVPMKCNMNIMQVSQEFSMLNVLSWYTFKMNFIKHAISFDIFNITWSKWANEAIHFYCTLILHQHKGNIVNILHKLECVTSNEESFLFATNTTPQQYKQNCYYRLPIKASLKIDEAKNRQMSKNRPPIHTERQKYALS